ncbi:MAG: hypothetical protein CL878_03695 [Dehalococcoidia bacterium]|nr:hypothetical protein [Dehalococcoidia bacterium]
MWQALFRKARADLVGRPLQTLLIFLTVALATATLTLAATVQRSASAAFDRTFAAANGAHVWFGTDADPAYLAPIGELADVTAITGPYPAVSGPFGLVTGTDKDPLSLRGLPAELPEVGRPMIAAGRWLAAGATGEIVLDLGLTQRRDIAVGERVEVLTDRGTQTLHVVGLAVLADRAPYPVWDPAVGFVLPATLSRFEPDTDAWSWRLGVQLAEPDATQPFLDRARALYPEGEAPGALTWQQVRGAITQSTFFDVLLLTVFGVFALVAVGFVIVNAVAGYVLAQIRDIGLLKAVGFTPRLVTNLFLLEHVGLGLLAALAGAGLGAATAPLLVQNALHSLGTALGPTVEPLLLAAIVGGVTLAIALLTLLPAWRGGRIATVQAITTGLVRPQTRPSRPAALAAWLRLPATIVLGVKDAFNRPVRSALTVAALAVAVMTVTFTVGIEQTIQRLPENPGWLGFNPFEVRVDRQSLSDEAARRLIDARPEVETYLSRTWVFAQPVGSDVAYNTRALGGAYEQFRFRVPEGRMFSAPGEAVIGVPLATILGVDVGDELQLDVDGQLLTLQLVGTYVTGSNDGRMLMYSLETLHQQISPQLEPRDYGLKLVPGADAQALKDALLQESGNQLNIVNLADELDQSAGPIQLLLRSLTAVLLAIAAVNVLTTLLFAVRERHHDLGILKAVGMTPGQIVRSVLVGATLLAVLGVAVGAPLGLGLTRVLFDYMGTELGVGTGVIPLPGAGALALLVPLALLVAVIGAALPARRAAGVSVAAALRYE